MNAKVEDVDLKAAVEEGLEPAPIENEIEITWSPEEAEEAEAMGWIPPERSKKLPEGKSYVGPVEYMKRNPLYNKVKQLETGLNQLNTHYQNVSKLEREKVQKEFQDKLEKLEAEKIEALDAADHKRVVEIDKEIRSAEKSGKQEEAKTEDPAFTEWKSKNDWYENDKFLQIEADIVGERLYSKDLVGIPLFEAVKEHLKQAYPDKFKNPNREKPSAVEEGSARPVKKNGSAAESDLTADEMTIYKNFKNMGVFKEEGSAQKYLNEVIALRD